MNAYRRMIWEDERAAPEERLGFALHLGDFVYEVVQYPDQVKDGHRYDRVIKFPIKFPQGKSVAKNRFMVPASLEDYRVLYHAYLQDRDLQPTVNLLLHHGVRSALEFASSGDLAKAHAVSNPDLAPHLSFVDMGGHGYSTVRVDASTMMTEFVCIPRPIERSPGVDGGPLRYRVRHEVPLWRPGEWPRMRQTILEGDAGLAM